MTASPCPHIWYELLSRDPAASQDFYGQVLGWTFRDSGHDRGYQLLMAGDVAVGGLMRLPDQAVDQGMPPGWLGYVGVPDVDAQLARITAAGGRVCMPAMDIPRVGRIALVADPQGALVYVMTPAMADAGGGRPFSPGQPGHAGWNELHARDGDSAFAFYAEQFGWTQTDAMDMGPGGLYRLFSDGNAAQAGGMMSSPDFLRPMWVYYFNVDDIVAAEARIKAAGGEIIMGPHEVPGGLWIILGKDTLDTLFAVVGPRD